MHIFTLRLYYINFEMSSEIRVSRLQYLITFCAICQFDTEMLKMQGDSMDRSEFDENDIEDQVLVETNVVEKANRILSML